MASPTSIATERFDKVSIFSLEDLRRWLGDHHAQEESVWLVRYQKSVPQHFVGRKATRTGWCAFRQRGA